MSKIAIRPDMRTSNGEVSDLVLNGRYVGNITLVYREGSRMSGSVQLERSTLSPGDKRRVVEYVQEYINSFASAIEAEDCDVIVTYSHFDQVIAMEHNIGQIEYFLDEVEEADELDYDMSTELEPDEKSTSYETYGQQADYYESDDDPASYGLRERHVGDDSAEEPASYEPRGRRSEHPERFERRVIRDESAHAPPRTRERRGAAGGARGARLTEPDLTIRDDYEAERFELVITGEHDDSIEYHIYGHNRRWLAEAFVTLYDSDVIGEINWIEEPTPDRIESAVDLLVSDFDDDLVDSFQLEVKHNGELLEVYELEHEDIADYEDVLMESGRDAEDYSIHLVRDDGDTLTYDIFSRDSGGSIPIGTATVDISRRELTGHIDFREIADEDDHERIATLLMRELDKDKDYDSFNITVLYKNRRIDELLFENTPIQ